MKEREARIVKRDETSDVFYFELLDEDNRRHIVQIPRDVASAEPQGFERGTDDDHVETIARGIVLSELNEDVCFHNVSRGQIERAYKAVKAKSEH